MEGSWVASIVMNGCFTRVPCGAVAPANGDILIKRNNGGNVRTNCGGFTIVKVGGVYPHTSQIALQYLVCDNGRWWFESTKRRTDGSIQNGQWRCYFNKKIAPKALPDAPIAPQATIRQVPPHILDELSNNYELLHLTFDKEYECPICLGIIEGDKLHITKCGHFFCKECVEGLPPQWERTNGCPQCRARA